MNVLKHQALPLHVVAFFDQLAQQVLYVNNAYYVVDGAIIHGIAGEFRLVDDLQHLFEAVVDFKADGDSYILMVRPDNEGTEYIYTYRFVDLNTWILINN